MSLTAQIENEEGLTGEAILSTALEEELKVLDLVLWLNCEHFILFYCYPLFLHFLTLIIFALWNSRKPRQLKLSYRQEWGTQGSVPGDASRGPLSFTFPEEFSPQLTVMLTRTMQQRKTAVWGGLTNHCEKKRSDKQRRKEKIKASECRVPKNSKES